MVPRTRTSQNKETDVSMGNGTKFVLPTAQFQTSVSPDKINHSANSGVIVERIGLPETVEKTRAFLAAVPASSPPEGR